MTTKANQQENRRQAQKRTARKRRFRELDARSVDSLTPEEREFLDTYRPWIERQQAILDRARKKSYLKKISGKPQDPRLAVHGISNAAHLAMRRAQNGRCALCHRPSKPGVPLQIDHCHATGRVRGLLCGRCNTALGLLRDDRERILAAAEYLERHAAVTEGSKGSD